MRHEKLSYHGDADAAPVPHPYLYRCLQGDDLAAFLGRHRHLVVGKRVLDLGTGTGIAGLAAAQCGAREVILTDHAAMEALVRSNVERNAGRWASRVSFTAFAW